MGSKSVPWLGVQALYLGRRLDAKLICFPVFSALFLCDFSVRLIPSMPHRFFFEETQSQQEIDSAVAWKSAARCRQKRRQIELQIHIVNLMKDAGLFSLDYREEDNRRWSRLESPRDRAKLLVLTVLLGFLFVWSGAAQNLTPVQYIRPENRTARFALQIVGSGEWFLTTEGPVQTLAERILMYHRGSDRRYDYVGDLDHPAGTVRNVELVMNDQLLVVKALNVQGSITTEASTVVFELQEDQWVLVPIDGASWHSSHRYGKALGVGDDWFVVGTHVFQRNPANSSEFTLVTDPEVAGAQPQFVSGHMGIRDGMVMVRNPDGTFGVYNSGTEYFTDDGFFKDGLFINRPLRRGPPDVWDLWDEARLIKGKFGYEQGDYLMGFNWPDLLDVSDGRIAVGIPLRHFNALSGEGESERVRTYGTSIGIYGETRPGLWSQQQTLRTGILPNEFLFDYSGREAIIVTFRGEMVFADEFVIAALQHGVIAVFDLAAPPNLPPFFTSNEAVSGAFVDDGSERVFRFPVEDPDGDMLSLEADTAKYLNRGAVVKGRFDPETQSVEVVLDGIGGVAHDIVVIDGRGGIASLNVNVQVIPNTAPVLITDTFNIQMSEDGDPKGFSGLSLFARDENLVSVLLNPETLQWRVSNDPIGEVSLTSPQSASARLEEIGVNYVPRPNFFGRDIVEIEVRDQAGQIDTATIRIDVEPENDRPTNHAVPSYYGVFAVGETVGVDPGAWRDVDGQPTELAIETQWYLASDASGSGKQDMIGQTGAVLWVKPEYQSRYLGATLTVRDVNHHKTIGSPQTSAAVRWELPLQLIVQQAPHHTDTLEPPFETLDLALAWHLNVGGLEFLPGAWIVSSVEAFNVRYPDQYFRLRDRLTPWPNSNFFLTGGLEGHFLIENPRENWKPRNLLRLEDLIRDGQETLEPVLQLPRDETHVQAGPNEFWTLHVEQQQELLPNGRRRTVGTLMATNKRAGITHRREAVTQALKLGPEGRRLIVWDFGFEGAEEADGPPGSAPSIDILSFPELNLLAEYETSFAPVGSSQRSPTPTGWGLGPDDDRVLILSRLNWFDNSTGISLGLHDPQAGQVVKLFAFDRRHDRVLNQTGRVKTQVFGFQRETNPITVSIDGEACFILVRSIPLTDQALLELRSWRSGEVKRSFMAPDGHLNDGDFFVPGDPRRWVYGTVTGPKLCVLNLETGEIERLFEPFNNADPLSSTVSIPGVRVSADGDFLAFEEVASEKVPVLGFVPSAPTSVAFHPDAPGDIEGIAFEDQNENGRLDLGLIQSSEPDIIYIIDVSGSAEETFVGTSVGDLDGDGKENTILDAQLAAFRGFHQNLIRFGLAEHARVAVVMFADNASAVDLSGLISETQALQPALADRDGNLVADTFQALSEIRIGHRDLGTGTVFGAALQEALDIFQRAQARPENSNIIFLSDGEPNDSFASIAEEIRDLGVNLRAIGVGRGSSLDNLRLMDPAAVQVNSSQELIQVFQPEEPLLEGIELYVDLNDNGRFDSDEPTTRTSVDQPFSAESEKGRYAFQDIPSHDVKIRLRSDEFSKTLEEPLQVKPVVASHHQIPLKRRGGSPSPEEEPQPSETETAPPAPPSVPPAPTIPAPRIVVHPQSLSVAPGSDIVLTVFAEGEVSSYQWSFSGQAIAGTRGPLLQLVGLSLDDLGEYRVTISGPGGAVTSEPALLSFTASVSPFLIDPDSLTVFEIGGRTNLMFRSDTEPGTKYQVEMIEDVRTGVWTPVGPLQVASGETSEFLLDITGQQQVFFRVVRLEQ